MASLHFDASLGMDGWRRNIREIQNDINNINRNVQSNARNIDNTFKNLSTAIGGYFSVNMLQGFIMKVIEVRGEFQKTEIALQTMLKSTVKAQELIGQMTELAEKTPFSFREVSDGAKQLLAFQVPANQVVDTLRRMGDIASGLGVPLSRIQLVYGQVRAKNKLMGDDLRQFTEAGIPIIAELGKKLNKTSSEIYAMVSEGKIGFNDVKDVLFNMTNEGGLFFNLMEKQSKTLSGRISNLGDVFEQMLNKIGQANEGMLNSGIDGIAYLIEHYEQVIKAIKTVVEIYGLYRAALLANIALQKSAVMWEQVRIWVALARSIRSTADAQALLNLTLGANPYAKIITVIGALLVVLFNYREEIKEVLGFVEQLSEAQKFNEAVTKKYNDTFGKGVSDTRSAIQNLIYVIKSEYSSLEQRKEAYKRLIGINEGFTDSLDGTYKATARLTTTFDQLIRRMGKLAMAQAEASVKMEKFNALAETERDVGINTVKLDDAKKALAEIEAQFKKGNDKNYLKNVVEQKEKIKEITLELNKQNEVLKAQSKEKEYIQRLESKQLEELKKGIAIQEAQLRGGKIQGRVLSDREKKSLQAELNNNKEIFRVKIGLDLEEPEEMEKTKALGWAGKIKARIKEIQDSMDGMSELDYRKAEKKLEELNEMLHPKKKKQDNRQIAEIFPVNSIKDLQRRVSLFDEAISTASNGLVKLRKLDKYGRDKDKKGNPYFTGEVVNEATAVAERQKLLDKLAEQENKTRAKTLLEALEDNERQWQNYYTIAQHYSKEIADNQFKDLKASGNSYADYLRNELSKLEIKGGISPLTDADKDSFTWLTNKLNELGGIKTPLENFKTDVENALAGIPNYVQQLEYLEEAINMQEKTQGVNSVPFLQMNMFTEEKKAELLQGQKDLYAQFLIENETFESQRVGIQEKYDRLRAELASNFKHFDPAEYLRLYDQLGRDEATAYQGAFMNVFEKSDVWKKVFGNIDALTKREISQLIPALEAKMQELIKLGAPIAEIEKFRQKLDQLKYMSSGGSPLTRLINNFKELRKKVKEGTATEEDFQRLRDSIGEVTPYAQMATQALGEMAEALGVGGAGNPYEKFVKDLTQTINGLVDAVVGYFSGNMQQMVSGIIQMVVGIVKMLSTAGDGRKESQIRKWKLAVDELKQSYEELEKQIAKTAGEGQLRMQRELIANLRQQQKLLIDMKNKETQKKKSDQDKIAQYANQINDINHQIQGIVDDFQKAITTTDFKTLSEKIGQTLVDAFGKGEDSANAFGKAVDEVMRTAVQNALRIKFLEPAVKNMVDQLYKSMGYGNGDTTALEEQISNFEKEIAFLEQKIANAKGIDKMRLESQKQAMLQLIQNYKQQIAEIQASGDFDGLTPAEREAIKAMGEDAMKKYMEALQQYEDLFGSASENANSLKGDIKGVTEKTAGILEAQINAMRINQVEILQLARLGYQIDQKALILLSEIAENTRPIPWIYEKLKKVIP